MAPTLNDGDYILIKKPRSARAGFLKLRSIYVLHHDQFGVIVKRLTEITHNGLKFTGDNPHSTSSDRLGLVQHNQIMGRAMIAITPSGLKKL